MQIIVSNLFTTSLTRDVAACLWYESIYKSFTLGPEKEITTTSRAKDEAREIDDDVMYSRAMNNNINLT
jgi:hypothetical protein